MKLTRPTIGWVVVLLAAGACSDDTPDGNVVARAGSVELTVDDVVDLLVDREDLPVTADLVEAVAELWIDYSLLASEAAEDSTLSDLDFQPMVRAGLDQELLVALRDSAIQVDTIVTDEDLRTLYESSGGNVRYRARHIMLQYPLQATQSQRDSVRDRLGELRSRITGGASFEELARSFSQDRGSASAGGDLGFFGPGDMVRPFEDAISGLEPGEVSEIVETPMGLHLIRLDERERPVFEDVSSQIATQLRGQRAQEAESVFVSGVEERAGALTVVDEASAVVRDLAANPSVRLSGRAARRPLVEWPSGALTAGRVLELLRLEPPAFQQQVADGEDEALDGFLLALARRELLLDEARASGLEASQARADSLAAELSAQIRTAARRLGLLPLERAPGERLEPAVRRAALDALSKNLTGASPTLPLGPLSYQLRSGTTHGTLNAGVGRAVLELGRQRASRGLSADEMMPGEPPAVADSVGS